ncbi:MAG: GNAT family N-acetyltransferase [Rhizobiales bacterium]|nr:GNAT family N-acetyltransferase [Hyphomicrobiales bacterium]
MAAKSQTSWLIEPLGKHDRAAFSCEEPSLTHYLKEQASQDAKRHIAAPFVAVTVNDRKTVLGYYTLSATNVELRDIPESHAKKLPRYPLVPATLLGRLARDESMKGKGLGEFLLLDAIHRAVVQSKQIASAAIVVDAISDAAARFYRHFNFIVLADRKDRLFLPMGTAEKLFD